MRSLLSFLRQKMRPPIYALVFFLAAWPMAPVSAANNLEPGVIGKWRLVKVLDSADISALDDREAQQLVGRVFTISRETVKIGKANDCLPPDFKARIVEPRWYVREWAHASAEHLGLPNPVTVVDLGCTNAFIKSPKRIVVFWKGWFFDAKRMR